MNDKLTVSRVFLVLFASAIALSYGGGSAMLGFVSLSTQLSIPHANLHMLLPAAIDILLGSLLVVAGLAALLRIEWARKTLVALLLGSAFLELGRRTAAATIAAEADGAFSLGMIGLTVLLAFAAFAANAQSSRVYTRRTRHSESGQVG
ncbi:hypothetical protein [Usitatibacter palustris]|uniref:hypothetical protein n=1 Tax=Usitatibacter palustris TaxID=2732487 RepID=UPI001489A789|nr:hypothetical protein [Usitatibacter palustris]